MEIKPYNNSNRTREYIEKLKKWVERYGKKRKLEEDLRFPINRRGDIILIIEPESFDFFEFDSRESLPEDSPKNIPARVIGLFDTTTGDYHGSPDDRLNYDLEVDDGSGSMYISPYSSKGPYMPPFIFLPHLRMLGKFKGLLPEMYSKKPLEKLKEVLDAYYQNLKRR